MRAAFLCRRRRSPQRLSAARGQHHGARWQRWARSGSAAGWTLGQAVGPWTSQDLLHYNLRENRGKLLSPGQRRAAGRGRREGGCWGRDPRGIGTGHGSRGCGAARPGQRQGAAPARPRRCPPVPAPGTDTPGAGQARVLLAGVVPISFCYILFLVNKHCQFPGARSTSLLPSRTHTRAPTAAGSPALLPADLLNTSTSSTGRDITRKLAWHGGTTTPAPPGRSHFNLL